MLPQFSLSCNSGSSGSSTRHKSPKREILLNLLVVFFSTNKWAILKPCYPFRFPWGSVRKESTCNEGDVGLIPGLGRSPGGGHGNRLQYSGLANPHGQRSLMGCSPWGLMGPCLFSATPPVQDRQGNLCPPGYSLAKI